MACGMIASCATLPAADEACLHKLDVDRPTTFPPGGVTSTYRFSAADSPVVAEALLQSRLPFVRLNIDFSGGGSSRPLFVSSRRPLRSRGDLAREAAKVCRLEQQGLVLGGYQRDPAREQTAN